jgi:hypothetical protein
VVLFGVLAPGMVGLFTVDGIPVVPVPVVPVVPPVEGGLVGTFCAGNRIAARARITEIRDIRMN